VDEAAMRAMILSRVKKQHRDAHMPSGETPKWIPLSRLQGASPAAAAAAAAVRPPSRTAPGIRVTLRPADTLAERMAHATRERAFRGAWAGAPDLYPPPLVGADKRFAFRASPDAAGPRPTPAARDFVVPPATMRMPGAQRAVGEDMPVRVMSGRMAGGWKQPAGVLYVDAGGLAFIPTA